MKRSLRILLNPFFRIKLVFDFNYRPTGLRQIKCRYFDMHVLIQSLARL